MTWGIAEVMTYTGLGRKSATRLLNLKSCPKLPRKKGQTFKVPKEAFIKWYEGGIYD